MSIYTAGTVPLSTWQVKLAQRIGGFEPGTHVVVVNVAPGTAEPTWSVLRPGKVENTRSNWG